IRRSSSYGGRYGSSPITVLCGRWRENPAVSVVGLRCGFLVVVHLLGGCKWERLAGHRANAQWDHR
ncbi:MAG: hypothetical protein LAT55_10905, partial [Opitutales bacterium]|nr:hypothetical protein [Opitutales bacterium]